MARNIFIGALPPPEYQDKMKEVIETYSKYLKVPLRIDWAPARDFHITLGYLRDVEELDLQKIVQGFSIIKDFKALQAVVYDAKLYGKAISLDLQPLKLFESMHKKLIQALESASQGKYQFSTHKTFEAHITLGRLRDIKHRVPLQHAKTITEWANRNFRNFTFPIEEMAIMHRLPSAQSSYQKLTTFKLKP